MLSRGRLQHAGLRLAARARIVFFMRTIVQCVDMRITFGQLHCHQFVNSGDQRFRKVPVGDPGLIGDHNDRQLRSIELPDCLRSKWKHTKTAYIVQVANFFGDGSVAVKEDRRTQRCSFSQKPPPRHAASHAPPPRQPVAEHWSCNGDRSDSAAENTDCSKAFLVQPCSVE